MITHSAIRAEATTFAAGVLAAGALLLGVPAGLAVAAEPPGGGTPGGIPGGPGSVPGDPTPGGPGGTPGPGDPGYPSGVGNRPALTHPAPLVTFGQTVGDQFFNDDQPLLNNSPAGVIYHVVLGSAGQPDDGDGIREPGEAYQGAYRGVLNHLDDRNTTSRTVGARTNCREEINICR